MYEMRALKSEIPKLALKTTRVNPFPEDLREKSPESEDLRLKSPITINHIEICVSKHIQTSETYQWPCASPLSVTRIRLNGTDSKLFTPLLSCPSLTRHNERISPAGREQVWSCEQMQRPFSRLLIRMSMYVLSSIAATSTADSYPTGHRNHHIQSISGLGRSRWRWTLARTMKHCLRTRCILAGRRGESVEEYCLVDR